MFFTGLAQAWRRVMAQARAALAGNGRPGVAGSLYGGSDAVDVMRQANVFEQPNDVISESASLSRGARSLGDMSFAPRGGMPLDRAC